MKRELPPELEAQVKRLTDHVPFSTMSPQEYRETLQRYRKELSNYMDRYPRVISNDICVESRDGYGIPVRIYKNKDTETSSDEVLIYLFGGGFVEGGLDSQDEQCRYLVEKTGKKVISISYRLAPEFKYPVGYHDSLDATQWLISHSEKLAIDLDRITLCGYSSGATFVALMCNELSRDEKYIFDKQILISPCLDFSRSCESHEIFSSNVALDKEDLTWHYKHYLKEENDRTDPRVSPFWENNFQGNPKTLITVDEFCPFRDEGIEYAGKLKSFGIEVKLNINKSLHVGFVFAPDSGGDDNPLEQIIEFLIKDRIELRNRL